MSCMVCKKPPPARIQHTTSYLHLAEGNKPGIDHLYAFLPLATA